MELNFNFITEHCNTVQDLINWTKQLNETNQQDFIKTQTDKNITKILKELK